MLAYLHNRFPTAMYAYLRIANLVEEQRRFLQNEVRNPHFVYHNGFSQKYFKARLHQLQGELTKAHAAGDDNAIHFIKSRSIQTELLLRLAELVADGALPTQKIMQEYRQKMVELYGEPNADYFLGIVDQLEQRAHHSRDPRVHKIWRELRILINVPQTLSDHSLPQPDAVTFDYYKHLLHTLYPDFMFFLRGIPAHKSYGAAASREYFQHGLDVLGATVRGWRAKLYDDSPRIMVAKHRKRVLIGTQFRPTSHFALQQLLTHELVGHVQFDIVAKHRSEYNEAVEEGTAVMLEQLLAADFKFKRLMRYLAAAVSFGTDGKPRDFRDTHDIVWRGFVVLTGCSIDEAKKRAFRECVRVFRGGLPDMPGIVFLKDMVYLEGNLLMWRVLSRQQLSAEEFNKLIKGQTIIHTSEVE